MTQHERKHKGVEPENVKEILGVVFSEIRAMIKSIRSSVFSEEAGRNIGRAAATYYNELKDGGLQEQVTVKMQGEHEMEKSEAIYYQSIVSSKLF